MPVISMRKASGRSEPTGQPDARPRKCIKAVQKALDEVKLGSGTWQIEGVPGLYLRARSKSKSFFLQRRVNGILLNRTLGELTMKEARERAALEWGLIAGQTQLTAGAKSTFADAFKSYQELSSHLAQRTTENYESEFTTYLPDLHGWSMKDLGSDEGRHTIQQLQIRLRKQHGKAASNQAMRLISAVYNKARKTDSTLPSESPTKAIKLDKILPRQSALDDDQLRAWGAAVIKLSAVKRMFWIMALLTGARELSMRLLKWTDLCLDNNMIRFRNKRNGYYAVPMSDLLCTLLTRYRDSESTPASPWVFPSPRIDGQPLGKVKEKEETGQPRIKSPHSLRHTFKTRGIAPGADYVPPEISKLLMGHSADGEAAVNFDYITLALILEPTRPYINMYARKYAAIVPELLA